LIPSARLLPEFPSETVDSQTAARIRQGRDFRVSPFRIRGAPKHVKAVTEAGELVAIGEAVLPNLYHPMLVL
jgi:tRNA pseudouridine55 synthase